MASRYLVATGNWNGAVWAATSGGAAGSAGTPTASDDVYIAANFTVTLTANAEAYWISHTNGTLSTNGYDLTLGSSFSSTGTNARTINMGSSTWTVTFDESDFSLSGSNLTFNSGSSLLVLNTKTYSAPQDEYFNTGSKTFNDVRINMGSSGSYSAFLNITGSPTFRLLDIRSTNSAAHTVTFDDDVYVSKLIAIGSSSGNKLTIENTNSKCFIFGESNTATTYGQFVAMAMQAVSNTFYDDPVNPTYIGSNSTTNTTGWLLQDPPKISTLVDPLTTAPGSNTNWTVTGTVTQVTTGHDGGGYSLASGAKIVSTDTYDAVSSSIVFETNSVTTLTFKTWHDTHSLIANKYYRFNVSSGGTYKLENSNDGTSWSTVVSTAVDNPEIYDSMRLEFGGGTGVIGSINPTLVSAPAVTTGSATSIGTTSATLGGNVTSDGGATITERGVCWSTSANPTTTSSKATSAGTTGSYTVSATSLTANTTYHYRAYAINSEGTSYGSDTTFTTSPITDIDGDTATSSTTISSPSLTIGTSLSNNNQVSTVSISSLSLISATNLAIDNMSLSQSISSPSVVLIKGIYPDSMVVGVSENSLDLLLSADLGVNNLSVAVAESSVVVNKTTLMELDNLSLLTTSDNIGLGINTSISIDPISLSTAIEHGLVNIGYVIPNITSDNIYAIGVIRTGDYEVATNNTDNTYKVVEL